MADPSSSAAGDPAPTGAAPAAAVAPAPATDDHAAVNRSKKREGRKRGAKGAALQESVTVSEQQSELVRLVRAERRTDAYEDSSIVQLSAGVAGKAPQLVLSQERMAVTGHKGFRTVRATHGVFQGTWYAEVKVQHLGATGHVRLGWCTKKAELQAPVGFDTHGFAYRDLEGSKVHNGFREPYGAAFKEGDTVGLLLHMPEGGRPIEPQERKVFRYKGSIWYEEEQEPKPTQLQGSAVHFFLNGVHQGVAYTDILEGTYYPAVSLFTLPEQKEGASVQVNFGPEFAFPPALPEGLPAARPMSEVAAVVAAAAAALAAAQEKAAQEKAAAWAEVAVVGAAAGDGGAQQQPAGQEGPAPAAGAAAVQGSEGQGAAPMEVS